MNRALLQRLFLYLIIHLVVIDAEFFKPFNVSYDHRTMIIDGKRRMLIFTGIHYPRATPQMWSDLITKSKEGGADVIQTYVFWNGHEPVRGQYNFEGRYDIVKFVKLVGSGGLYLHLRIGPYVCAEWNFGGFPVWLRDIPGIEFRTDNEPFKEEIAGLGGLVACGALSLRNSDPTKASRPWDINRDGFVMGEGAGVLLLEELEHATKRGTNIYAEFLGGSFTSDAYHITESHPDGTGISLCMEKALTQSSVAREDVNYINAHDSSTPSCDLREYQALIHCFGQKVNSSKSMIGHLLGAAGAVEAVATIKAIQTGWVHPNINLEKPDEGVRWVCRGDNPLSLSKSPIFLERENIYFCREIERWLRRDSPFFSVQRAQST